LHSSIIVYHKIGVERHQEQLDYFIMNSELAVGSSTNIIKVCLSLSNDRLFTTTA